LRGAPARWKFVVNACAFYFRPNSRLNPYCMRGYESLQTKGTATLIKFMRILNFS